ncbi:Transmembrane protein 110 [Heterocephalus glaber]|uniref:Transmembrane protein 110 n=1 Tax=Heterocephalus glaber TaxID=10181 RepID=G5AZ58_HETGA|nr:Transmembrane protein 110 [Heterocephalus glaber]
MQSTIGCQPWTDLRASMAAGLCESDALMYSFAIFIQGLLGILAFSTLMLKHFREPKHERRPWRIWFLNTSKQAIETQFIHFANVYLADLTEEDPCSLYLINFLLDLTMGMLLIYVGVCAVSVLIEWQQWESLRFGEYGDPLLRHAWVGQCTLYLVIMIFEKSVVFIVLLTLQWKKVALLNPIENPDLKLAIVMLIVPFFVNILISADEMEESDVEEDLRRLTHLKSGKKKKHHFGLPV